MNLITQKHYYFKRVFKTGKHSVLGKARKASLHNVGYFFSLLRFIIMYHTRQTYGRGSRTQPRHQIQVPRCTLLQLYLR